VEPAPGLARACKTRGEDPCQPPPMLRLANVEVVKTIVNLVLKGMSLDFAKGQIVAMLTAPTAPARAHDAEAQSSASSTRRKER